MAPADPSPPAFLNDALGTERLRLAERTPAELISDLTALSRGEPVVMAFDADGTLWSGDVSDDVFLAACRDQWLLDAAKPALCRQAQSIGLSTAGSASDVALRLFEAHQQGLLHESALYTTQAWCYAGRHHRELTEYAAGVLTGNGLPHRLRAELGPVLSWARQSGVECLVISASPRPIVTWAAAHWGFASDRVFGAQPSLRDGIILDRLDEEVPFAAQKCKLLERHAPTRRLLAAFGDSHFDFEMLQSAELPVAVHPKPTLTARLLPLNRAVVLGMQ